MNEMFDEIETESAGLIKEFEALANNALDLYNNKLLTPKDFKEFMKKCSDRLEKAREHLKKTQNIRKELLGDLRELRFEEEQNESF